MRKLLDNSSVYAFQGYTLGRTACTEKQYKRALMFYSLFNKSAAIEIAKKKMPIDNFEAVALIREANKNRFRTIIRSGLTTAFFSLYYVHKLLWEDYQPFGQFLYVGAAIVGTLALFVAPLSIANSPITLLSSRGIKLWIALPFIAMGGWAVVLFTISGIVIGASAVWDKLQKSFEKLKDWI